MAQFDYKSAGVNIELGDDASKVLYEAAKLTWQNRKGKLGEVVEIFPDFSGLRAIRAGGLPEDAYFNISFDGVGTKILLLALTGNLYVAGQDAAAMGTVDMYVSGSKPLYMTDTFKADVLTLTR